MLAREASPTPELAKAEKAFFQKHRGWLLGIGIDSGYLGAAPSLVWVSGAMVVTAIIYLVPLAIWIYTLVFAFAASWFAHFTLAELKTLRAKERLGTLRPESMSYDGKLPIAT